MALSSGAEESGIDLDNGHKSYVNGGPQVPLASIDFSQVSKCLTLARTSSRDQTLYYNLRAIFIPEGNKYCCSLTVSFVS